jgi:hypothetical protein
MLRVVVALIQTDGVPVIDGTALLTVTFVTEAHPPAMRYVICVVPDAIPVTTPPALTVAMELILLLHTPAEVALAKVVVSPTQVIGVPVLADNVPPTVTVLVRAQPLPAV